MNKIKYIFAASVIAAQAACGALVVSNVAPTNVLTTSAWFNGEVIDGTNPTLTLYYGTIDRTTNASFWTFSSNYGAAVVGNITLQITNLVAANKYYFRWYATEAGSNVWSVDGTDNFWTKPTSPTSTPAVVSISVQTDEDADLLSPTNFFGKNASKMHDALSVYGYLTNEALWTAVSNQVQTDLDNLGDATNALNTRAGNLESATNALNIEMATKVSTNFTGQLDFTGADILIADGTATNNPVTKAQLDANSGTTNATGINVAFTPTNYTPDGASVEGHLIGIDAVVSSGSGFPLTNDGNLSGFSLTNGGLVQAVSGEFDYVDIGSQLRMTNSESAGALEVVDVMVDADIDDAYYARRNGAWADIDLLGLRGATNALNTRVGVLETSTNAINIKVIGLEASSNALNTRVGLLETSTNALNTRMGAVETATGALNTAVGNLNNSTNALNAKVVALNNSTNALNTRVGKLEGSTNAMNKRLGSLEASTNAINTVANNALPKTFTNTGVMAAMQITGGSPSNGAVWVATNTVGQGTWSVLPKIYATSGDKGMVFSNNVFTPLVFTNNLKQVGGGTFDGTSWTPGIVGWGQVHVFVNAASHVSTGLFQLVATGESTGSQYQYIYIPNIVPRLSFSKLMYFETPESSVYFRILHVHGHNLTNSGTMSFYGAMLP